MDWKKAQSWERLWWANCVNTLFEEEKQIIYADKMGLNLVGNEKTPYVIDLNLNSVLDIGGGACSLLLKCIKGTGVVIDPLPLPEWVIARYKEAGIGFINIKGEDMFSSRNKLKDMCKDVFDEVWIYNVLQHTENPKKIIENALKLGKIVRIFEWINTPISDGHINTLTEKELNSWLGGEGKIETMNKKPTTGIAYYGIFKGI